MDRVVNQNTLIMTLLTNSSFKVKASSVATSVGIEPEAGALLFDRNLNTHVLGNGSAWVPVLVEPYADTFFVDMLGPLFGQRLDAAATRYSYNAFNGAIQFDSDARYTEEVIIQHVQIQHWFKLTTNGKPHLHWKQQSADIPNWLMAWKLDRNGEAGAVETDYSNFTFGTLQSHAFTYTSGVLNQISLFPDIDLSDANISDLLTIALWRDTANASTLFAGADPSALDELAMDLDTHIEIDTPGSRQEYVK